MDFYLQTNLTEIMQVGEVKCAEDVDFERLKQLCRCQDGWKLDYNKNGTTVSSKSNDVSDFKLIKVGDLIRFEKVQLKFGEDLVYLDLDLKFIYACLKFRF